MATRVEYEPETDNEEPTPYDKAPQWLKDFIFESLQNMSKDELIEQALHDMTDNELNSWESTYKEVTADEDTIQ